MTACVDKIPYIDGMSFRFDSEARSNIISFYRDGFLNKYRQAVTASSKKKEPSVPIWEKALLTIEEAIEYYGIGRDKLRELTDSYRCQFVVRVGRKRLIKRVMFNKYLDSVEEL